MIVKQTNTTRLTDNLKSFALFEAFLVGIAAMISLFGGWDPMEGIVITVGVLNVLMFIGALSYLYGEWSIPRQ